MSMGEFQAAVRKTVFPMILSEANSLKHCGNREYAMEGVKKGFDITRVGLF